MAKKIKKVCSCCGDSRNTDDFYKSQSNMFKNDNLLPICKDCVLDIYEENLKIYKDIEKALYKTLFTLDIYYDIKLAKKAIIDTYDNDKHVLKTYMSSINLNQYKDKTSKDSPPMNIWDVEKDNIGEYQIEELKLNPDIITKEILMRWGEGKDIKDYMFLEKEYETMCSTYGNRNPYSLSSYQQIALNRLFLRKEWEKESPDMKRIREINESISKMAGDCKMKEKQVSNTEDDNARFSAFIEEIELTEPVFNNPLFDDADFIYKIFKDDFRHPFAQALDIDDSGKKLKRKKANKDASNE